MEALRFIVKGQRLKKDPGSPFSRMVAGTSGFYKAVFDLDETWRGYSCIVCYQDDNIVRYVPIVNGEAAFPDDVLERHAFTVRVIGRKGATRLTTNENKIIQTGGK